MARNDLKVKGPQSTRGVYIAASGTAIQAGEPLHSLGTLTNGVNGTNESVLAAADTPVIGTHRFSGVAVQDSALNAAGTTLAQFLNCAKPVPYIGWITGNAEVVASVDTLSELHGLIGDVVLIDYNATGATDGGQLYTIKVAASADTSGLEIVGGNYVLGTLDVTVDARAYRHDVS